MFSIIVKEQILTRVFSFDPKRTTRFPERVRSINPSSFQPCWKGSSIVSIVSLMTPRWMIDNLGCKKPRFPQLGASQSWLALTLCVFTIIIHSVHRCTLSIHTHPYRTIRLQFHQSSLLSGVSILHFLVHFLFNFFATLHGNILQIKRTVERQTRPACPRLYGWNVHEKLKSCIPTHFRGWNRGRAKRWQAKQQQ